jgi:hypothetical protein
MVRALFELADIFQLYGPAYQQEHSLTSAQYRVMNAIMQCRTAELGGHIEQCDSCDYQSISYNSCRNRHCSKCQSLATAQWLLDRKNELLPVNYFHVVFKLPDILNPFDQRQLKLPTDDN